MKVVNNSLGFTLVELLIVVSLVIISAGVSGDIIVSLTRSYNKTQITNEIEQNANFVMLKLEKELKNSVGNVTIQNANKQLNFDVDDGGTVKTVTYEIMNAGSNGYIQRVFDGTAYTITNNTSNRGVSVNYGSSSFSEVPPLDDPTVVRVVLVFEQYGNPASRAFLGNITLENTIVVRGTY